MKRALSCSHVACLARADLPLRGGRARAGAARAVGSTSCRFSGAELFSGIQMPLNLTVRLLRSREGSGSPALPGADSSLQISSCQMLAIDGRAPAPGGQSLR